MSNSKSAIAVVFSLLLALSAHAQNAYKSTDSNDVNVSNRLLGKLHKHYDHLADDIQKDNVNLLSDFETTENRLQSILIKTDSLKSAQLFSPQIRERYQLLKAGAENLKNKKFPLQEYLPGTDSLQTSLSFLLQNKNLPTDKIEKLQALQSKIRNLQIDLQQANDIQTFVKQRSAELKSQIQNLGVAKQLSVINKKAFYYQEQLASYKKLLNDKDKLKSKLLSKVRELPVFQKFWQKHSYLSVLFPQPDGYGTPAALAGLQTRSSIQANVAQRIGTLNTVNAQQIFQQQVVSAQGQLNQLKDKIMKLKDNVEGGSGDMTMPDFKPNKQRTKTFKERLEYGFNIQNEPGTRYLPSNSNIALNAGYKFSDNTVAGIAVAYRLGLGHGIKDIHFTSEGIGLRSYLDVKAKGSIWISGGVETNYMHSFASLRELHANVDVWQKSALLGITKKFNVGKKEAKTQLLYDFLHAQQIPYAKGLKFRIGYNF